MWDSLKNAWVAQENQGNIFDSRKDLEIKLLCVRIQSQYFLLVIRIRKYNINRYRAHEGICYNPRQRNAQIGAGETKGSGPQQSR